MQIENWKDRSDLEQFRSIFFTSSTRKEFSDDIEKENFFKKYTYVYLTDERSIIFGAWDEQKLLGYITIFPDSINCADQYVVNPYYALFEDLFIQYPAHLHINCDESARGKGIGSKLIEEACKLLVSQNIPGVHLITSPTARNVSFYHRNGFDYSVTRTGKNIPFLFLGKTLL